MLPSSLDDILGCFGAFVQINTFQTCEELSVLMPLLVRGQ